MGCVLIRSLFLVPHTDPRARWGSGHRKRRREARAGLTHAQAFCDIAHACMYARMHARMHACMHACTHTHIYSACGGTDTIRTRVETRFLFAEHQTCSYRGFSLGLHARLLRSLLPRLLRSLFPRLLLSLGLHKCCSSHKSTCTNPTLSALPCTNPTPSALAVNKHHQRVHKTDAATVILSSCMMM